jgi:hypothetical protein
MTSVTKKHCTRLYLLLVRVSRLHSCEAIKKELGKIILIETHLIINLSKRNVISESATLNLTKTY